MADDINKLKENAKNAAAEFSALGEAFRNIQDELSQLVSKSENFDEISRKVARTYSNDFKKATEAIIREQDKIVQLQKKQASGTRLSAKEQRQLAQAQANYSKQRGVAENALNVLKRNGIALDDKTVEKLQEALFTSEEQIKKADELNNAYVAARGLTGSILDNGKAYLIKLDQTGLAAALLNNKLNATQKLTLAGEGAMLAFAKGALQASSNVANIQKASGLSAKNAREIQKSFRDIALSSDNVFINSIRLNESFRELMSTTGMVSDFGGDFLETFTVLNKQIGLGAKESQKLAFFARLQSTNTDAVLENAVDTLNTFNKTNRTSFTSKQILTDISQVSSAIAVSLGMVPDNLVEATSEARALGVSLAQIDQIASSLLQFESSIENELALQLVSGKQISFEKARQLALENDYAGLAKEIRENEELRSVFTNGNRIEQELAGKALGGQRDLIADMVMQQELLRLGNEGFIEQYGEQTFESLKALDAQQKFEASMDKLKGIISDVMINLQPVIDGIANMTSNSYVLYGILGAMAGLSLVKLIASITTLALSLGTASAGAITLNSALTFGLGAVALTAAIGVGMAAYSQAKQDSSQDIAQDFIMQDGKIQKFRKDDLIIGGTSLMSESSYNNNTNNSKIEALLEQLVAKNTNVYMDSSQVGYAEAFSYSKL